MVNNQKIYIHTEYIYRSLEREREHKLMNSYFIALSMLYCTCTCIYSTYSVIMTSDVLYVQYNTEYRYCTVICIIRT